MSANTDTHTDTGADTTPQGGGTYDTIVIGGGQAGLAAGYELQRTGRSFVILDAHPRIGDAWRTRWESLVLFTPSQINGLPGMPYPAPSGTFPTKDEFADYLESYAQRFDLPVHTSTRVTRLGRRGDGFVVQTDHGVYESANVVVAMGHHQKPKVPAFAAELDASIHQVHTGSFHTPSQLPPGGVLIVGAGNSGADIAMELIRDGREVVMAGKHPGAVPWRPERLAFRHVLIHGVRFMGHRVLNKANPIGRKLGTKLTTGGTPLIRVKPKDLVAAGVRRVGRITGVQDGRPVTADGERIETPNVLWATGYQPAFTWIDLPILGPGGEPEHDRGVATSEPGLYFLGLEFLRSVTSGTITGLARDARLLVRHLDARQPAHTRERVAA